MSVIADVEVSPEDFALGQTLLFDSGIRIRLERVIPVGNTLLPYLWISDSSRENIRNALAADSHVEAFDVVDWLDGEALVRMEWSESMDGLLDSLAATNAVILDAVGTERPWELQLRFDTHQNLAEFYRQCADRDIPVRLNSVHNPALPEDLGMHFTLTETQRETLLAALDAGYFDVPRRTNLVELSEELGVSDSAVSQRLRRGLATLITTTLASQDPGETPTPDE